VNKEITQAYIKTLFDYKGGNLYWKVKRKTVNPGSLAGRLSQKGYIQIGVDGKMYSAHRLIFLLQHGYLPKVIDHINGNKADNRIENLREASLSENQMNRKFGKNSSGVKGVVWHKSNKKWMAQLAIDGVNKYFGSFDDLELAELVVIEARNKYHGAYARNI